MNLLILRTTEFAGRTFAPGQLVTVTDRGIALALVGAQRACAADPEAAAALAGSPAPRRAAWTSYTPHATPLRLHR